MTPPSTAINNISKIDEGALIHVNSELKRPHAQSDAVSAESALLTTEHIAGAKKPTEAPMETPITNVAMNIVRPLSTKTAERYGFSEFKEVILW